MFRRILGSGRKERGGSAVSPVAVLEPLQEVPVLLPEPNSLLALVESGTRLGDEYFELESERRSNFSREEARFRSEATRLDVEKSKLLGVEALARQRLEAEIATLKSSAGKACAKGGRIAANIEAMRPLAKVYPLLSLEPLKWTRRGTGWPMLGVFSLNEAGFSISAGYDRYHQMMSRFSPELPEGIQELYKSTRDALCARLKASRWLDNIQLVAQFTGVIPNSVRGEIEKAKEFFGESLYIVAEVAEFVLNEVALIDEDPLVIGWDKESATAWLVSQFETTEVEKLMAQGLLGAN